MNSKKPDDDDRSTKPNSNPVTPTDKFLNLFEKDLEVRKREQDVRFAEIEAQSKAAENAVQYNDRDNQRQFEAHTADRNQKHERKVSKQKHDQRVVYLFFALVFVLLISSIVMIFIGNSMGKELLTHLSTGIISALGGYGFGSRKRKADSEDDDD
ncbi:hypothetical protein [Leptospira interrogans]|uniref:hypothetical protein n=1 Tax=Leptospira interrogans TaxID=173 RepID=UPI000A5D4C7C|nr:hypothetical protein [Leptospira interrogans]